MLGLWCCNAGGFSVVSLDSFVGIIVALLAIVVTLAVGWQIYNSMELKDKIEELNILKEEFQQMQETIEQSSCSSSANINFIWAYVTSKEIGNGNSNESDMRINIFKYFLCSLERTLHLKSPIYVEILLKNLEIAVQQIQHGSFFSGNIKKDIYEANASIRSTASYKAIEMRYNKIYEDFLAKIKNDK